MHKNKTKSTSKHEHMPQNHKKQTFDRKCQTPLISNMEHKKKSKSKDKSTDNKHHLSALQHLKIEQSIINLPNTSLNRHIDRQPKKQSPFKHKNRPISNLNNARHAKNIQHQLMHLNESINKHDMLGFGESNKKIKYDTNVVRILEEGKKYMKSNNFQKGLKIYVDCLEKDSKNLQALYLAGVCCYHLQLFQQAIKYFVNVLMQDQQYRKNIYLFLGICYKKVNMYDDSLLIVLFVLSQLTKAINLYPKYYDAVLLRSKILGKQKRHYDAIQDLNKCIKIDPKNLQAYVSKADSLRAINQFQEAIRIYSQVLTLNFDQQILLKRAIAYIECNSIQQALNDLNRIISKNSTNSEAYLFKGLAYAKAKNYNDAILSYQQSIKYNSSKKATTKALYEISKLKIQLGDFYGASYNMQRASSLEVDLKVLQKLKIFTQGSTSIMKKKFKKGIQNMNILIKKQHLSQQIKPLIYTFRSYAYFCQHKFTHAMNDLKQFIQNGYQMDPPSTYNFQLLEGIIACQNNQFKQSRVKFELANNSHPTLSDPLIYTCLSYIAEYNRNSKKKDISLLKEALRYILASLSIQDNYNSYYIISCIYYILDNYEQSLNNIEKAIQKSDDHVIKHFYLRALIKLNKNKYKEALNDFNNVISLTKDLKEKEKEPNDPDQPQRQKEILEAYLNRAKCYLIFDEKKKAFQDLQTYISCKPLDSEIHTVAGKLLFSIGACQDAVKAYNYNPNLQKNSIQTHNIEQHLLQRIKCYLVLKQLNLCLKDMQKMMQLYDDLIRYDYLCLSSLKEASKNTQNHFKQALKKIQILEGLNKSNGYIFNSSDIVFYKGLYFFYLGEYQKSIKLWNESKMMKLIQKDLQYLEGKSENLRVMDEQFENRIFTAQQIDYNIAIAYLMLNQLQHSIKTLSQYQSFNFLLNQNELIGNQQIDATPFPISNRLCSIFPEVEYNDNIKFKLSFCLPKIQPPQIKFQKEDKILEQLNMSSTDARPDAPWIKRNTYGVVFTDEVVGFDVDIQTEKSPENDEAIKIETQNQIDEMSNKKKNIKDLLALDLDLQGRLAKIIKKQKK